MAVPNEEWREGYRYGWRDGHDYGVELGAASVTNPLPGVDSPVIRCLNCAFEWKEYRVDPRENHVMRLVQCPVCNEAGFGTTAPKGEANGTVE